MKIFFRAATWIFYFCFRLFYKVRVDGDLNSVKGRAIIAPNHASFLDPPLIAGFWPDETFFLARASLFDSSFMGWLLPKLNAYPVHGTVQDVDLIKLTCQLLKADKKVVIFPEGNRSEDGQLQPVKSGIGMIAMRTNSPIIPVYLDGTFAAWPRHSRWPKINSPITIVVGQPIWPEENPVNKKEAQESLSNRVIEAIDSLKQTLKPV